ncbi:dihydrodipicolinate synthase family protein [Paenibacillus xerothermodurans]|uniref:Dihydrodipicolinate synthase family protein n=1 Tax=Paenibacillus xerothermodurans TaxID=1977292 RepID=A0A2W1ND81_PAEXE|nr:dihydrodipicolinate synthase family protein [Paenibacillus xerothermodurans]PZE21051.1 dihydrodipicolinate synthase family protein [Paenibacillus xerothermodurans]
MNYAEFSKKLETITAINITPFDEVTREIDWEGLEQNIEYLVANGAEVIVPCGNTSEFYALTLDEAKAETKRVVEIVNKRAIVMAGVGYSADTAIELGRHAQEVGADCVMIHQPIHPYITTPGAISYYRKVIEALDIPSILYLKDPQVSDDILMTLGALEKCVGVKYAINDLPRFSTTIGNVPKEYNIAWICGTAEKWAPYFYNAGARGFTSGLMNVYPEKSKQMLSALQAGDWDKVWNVWAEVLPFENLRARYNAGNNVVIVKEAMEQLGLRAGVPREPVDPLNQAEKQEVSAMLQKWGKLAVLQ